MVRQVDQNWTYIIPGILDFAFTVPVSEQAEISLKIRKEYFGQSSIDASNIHNITQMIGDKRFNTPLVLSAKLMAAKLQSPVWFFKYSYRATHSFSRYTSGSDINLGMCWKVLR